MKFFTIMNYSTPDGAFIIHHKAPTMKEARAKASDLTAKIMADLYHGVEGFEKYAGQWPKDVTVYCTKRGGTAVRIL